MKRAMAVCLILAVLAFAGVWAGVPKPGPTGEPVEVNQPTEGLIKPVLIEPFTWSMYGKVIAYYYQVRMPDGMVQQLKIKPELGKAAPTVADWQAKADAAWTSSKPDPNNVPKPCTRCGGSGVEP